jgi:predicted enzyme related to lactoylglutathione lyase
MPAGAVTTSPASIATGPAFTCAAALQGRGGAWIWIGVEDAEKLHDEPKARGVIIRMPLTNHSWALAFQVEDPDGNVIRFGSEPTWGATRRLTHSANPLK